VRALRSRAEAQALVVAVLADGGADIAAQAARLEA
jgi:hypothetical protein